MNTKIISKKLAGFTLIELLVVIAIIGILSSVVIASVSSSRVKARDAVRRSDVAEIKKALELYFAKCGTYVIKLNCTGVSYGSGGRTYTSGYLVRNYLPISSSYPEYLTSKYPTSVSQGLVDNGLTSKMIIEPRKRNGTTGDYMIFSNATSYQIWALLENPTTADQDYKTNKSPCYGKQYSALVSTNYCVTN